MKLPVKILRDLSERLGESMQEILTRAIEKYPQRHFLESANSAYAALRKQPVAWKQEQKERRAWDRTLRDGQRK